MPQFGAQIDTMRIPIKGLIAEQSASALASPVEGLLWHDTANKLYKIYLNGAWMTIANAASGVADGDKGDITVSGGGTVWTIDPNTITSAKIVDGTITTSDLAFTPILSGGTAGGDLTGTYPNPTIANNAVTSAKIADGTIVVADTASSFDIGSLSAAHPPSVGINMNGFIIGNVPAPTAGTDVANKAYVDNAIQGLDAKASCVAGTVGANITLAGGAPNVLDGVNIGSGYGVGARILVKDQTDQTQNGIYVIQTVGTGANGTWVRATDMDTAAEFENAYTWVQSGTVNADTGWVCTTTWGTWGTTPVTWVQFSGAGQINAGAGMTKTGNSLDVVAGDTSLVVNADEVHVNTAVIATVASLTAYAPLASPTFTGDPKVPNPPANDNDTSIASTAFVTGAISTAGGNYVKKVGPDTMNGVYTLAGGPGNRMLVPDTTLPQDTILGSDRVGWTQIDGSTFIGGLSMDNSSNKKMTLSYPTGTLDVTVPVVTFTGDARAVTATAGDNDTSIATTAFVQTAIAAKASKVFVTLPALTAGVETTVNHGLNTLAVIVGFQVMATNAGLELTWRCIDANNLGVTADVAFAASAVRCTVVG